MMEYISRAELPEDDQVITEIWVTYYPKSDTYGAGAMIRDGVRYLGAGQTADVALSFLMANIATGNHYTEADDGEEND